MLVRESFKAFANAPKSIKPLAENLRKIETERIKDMLVLTMHERVEESALKRLATVAAIEMIRVSPIYIDTMAASLAKDDPIELFPFSQWARKYMNNSAYNLLMLPPKQRTVETDFYSKSLNMAVISVGSKRKVLIALGRSEKEIMLILRRESKRLIFDRDVLGLDFRVEDNGSECYRSCISLLRNAERETRMSNTIN